jgi:scavenger receptor class B, member 1
MLALNQNSTAFEQWKKPSSPAQLNVYFFNWTNSEDFLDQTTKPTMEEIGPYRFHEIRDKTKITFNDKNATVSYRPLSTFYFDEDGSNGTLDDEITQLNIVAVDASAQALHKEYVERKQISMALIAHEEKIAILKSVKEFLFDGYEDDLNLMAREGLIEGFNIPKNSQDRIGWFYLVGEKSFLSFYRHF